MVGNIKYFMNKIYQKTVFLSLPSCLCHLSDHIPMEYSISKFTIHPIPQFFSVCCLVSSEQVILEIQTLRIHQHIYGSHLFSSYFSIFLRQQTEKRYRIYKIFSFPYFHMTFSFWFPFWTLAYIKIVLRKHK